MAALVSIGVHVYGNSVVLCIFRYPLKAVKVMHTVALRTESSLYNPTTSPGLVAPAQVWSGPF